MKNRYWTLTSWILAIVGALTIASVILAVAQYLIEPSVYEQEITTRTVTGIISAYTASPDETNERFWETARGKHVNQFTAACPPELAFGTVIEIAGKEYECTDRMNVRYRTAKIPHFDVIRESKEEAFEFGRQELAVVIYE